jgi:RNA polymerase sigma-70 factor (ECF subfamily)
MRVGFTVKRGQMRTGDNELALAHSWDALNQYPDEQLAALFLQGVQDSLAVLFDRYCRLVYSVAVRIVKDDSEAEDVVQTVFLDCSRALHNFDAQLGSFKLWLLQYAYHRALHRKRHLIANRFYSWVEHDDAHYEAHIPSASESIERAQLLQRLLEQTTPQRRTVLELTYCEGLTNEVSIQMGISANIVRHELYRGLSQLRKLTAASGVIRKASSSTILMDQAPHAQSI